LPNLSGDRPERTRGMLKIVRGLPKWSTCYVEIDDIDERGGLASDTFYRYSDKCAHERRSGSHGVK